MAYPKLENHYRFSDLTGQRFGRLLVLGQAGRRSTDSRILWSAVCDCGNVWEGVGIRLRAGGVRSCGCLRKVGYHVKHRETVDGLTPEYRAWAAMKARCFNPRIRNFRNHGGRGITVCAEWRDDFDAFLAHVGRKPSPRHSLDRIDNDGNYEPGNVRWATALEQRHNRRPWGTNRRAA